jgi:hypothetical protein
MTIYQTGAETRERWWSEMGDTFSVGTKPVTISVGQSQWEFKPGVRFDIETFGPAWLSTNNPQIGDMIRFVAVGKTPVKATRRGLWLHPTKGWRGKVRHPKRGRARPAALAVK